MNACPSWEMSNRTLVLEGEKRKQELDGWREEEEDLEAFLGRRPTMGVFRQGDLCVDCVRDVGRRNAAKGGGGSTTIVWLISLLDLWKRCLISS